MKNDLVRKLRHVVDALSDEDLDASLDENPGLDDLSAVLVQKELLEHKDKDVRLHTCLACMEIFYLYAPEPPWNEKEILAVFSQTIRQLGNLSHCTSPSKTNFHHYFRILEQLSTVKIGVVLVELVRMREVNSKGDENEPLETLASLIRTVLSCVQVDHPPEVSSHAISAVSACIEEFVTTIPIPILDEILMQIGAGPVTLITNPAAVAYAAKVAEAKKKRKSPPKEKPPPSQIQQTNQSYLVAASLIKRTEDRIASPISILLNGLLNSSPEVIEKTVISTSSESSDADVYCIIFELHRIAPPILTTIIGTVSANLQITDPNTRYSAIKLLGRLFYSKSGNIAESYIACLREWIRRHKDVDVKIRKLMVQCLVLLLTHHKPKQIRDLATQALIDIITSDPEANVRIDAIHQVCDLAHDDHTVVSPKVMQAIGSRIASKNKIERKDAATGLTQCYFKHFCMNLCSEVEKGGEDVDLSIILNVTDLTEDMYDTDTFYGSNHIKAQFEWIPGEIFKAACFTDQIDSDMRSRIVQILDDVIFGKPGKLSPTSRAVAFSVLFETIKDSDSEKWLGGLLNQRSALQKGLDRYIKARSKASSFKPSTEEYIVSDAAALDQLERLVPLSAPIQGISSKSMIEKLHSHRDKHLFRILSTIAYSRHSASARARAFNDLPRRTQGLGEPTTVWLKTLIRRCAMGGSINEEVISHCILLSQECFREGEYEKSMMFLSPVDFVTKSFPDLIVGAVFTDLIVLLGECKEAFSGNDHNESMQVMLSTICAILARTAPAAGKSGELGQGEKENLLTSDLQKNLVRLCTKEGTPEQSYFAIEVLYSLKIPNCLEALLKQLSSSQKLRIGNKHILSVFSALSALVERKPSLFDSDRGQKAIKFALEGVLLGKEEDTKEDFEQQGNIKSKKRRRKLAETKELPYSTLRINSAMNFLVTHARATLHYSKTQKNKLPSNEHIESLFRILFQIVEDKGLPPSSRDSTDNKLALASLRRTALVNILRLNDPSLQLTDLCMTPKRWHLVASSFLDPEKEVREQIIVELSNMISGQEKYCHGIAYAPSLRFLSMVCLCIDADSNLSVHNNDAASIGRTSQILKQATLKCINFLRKTSESTLTRCRAIGSTAESNFEKRYKFMLMPEYAVPYAIHTLCCRKETPTENDDDKTVLKRRLKFLLDPMVTSLGTSADNISFLLRMTELIGGRYLPVDNENKIEPKKVNIICNTAREILLKFVKKDVNLSVYPGQIQVPRSLYRPKNTVKKIKLSVNDEETPASYSRASFRDNEGLKEGKTDELTTPASEKGMIDPSPVANSSRVSFAKEIKVKELSNESDSEGSKTNDTKDFTTPSSVKENGNSIDFNGMSPISQPKLTPEDRNSLPSPDSITSPKESSQQTMGLNHRKEFESTELSITYSTPSDKGFEEKLHISSSKNTSNFYVDTGNEENSASENDLSVESKKRKSELISSSDLKKKSDSALKEGDARLGGIKPKQITKKVSAQHGSSSSKKAKKSSRGSLKRDSALKEKKKRSVQSKPVPIKINRPDSLSPRSIINTPKTRRSTRTRVIRNKNKEMNDDELDFNAVDSISHSVEFPMKKGLSSKRNSSAPQSLNPAVKNSDLNAEESDGTSDTSYNISKPMKRKGLRRGTKSIQYENKSSTELSYDSNRKRRAKGIFGDNNTEIDETEKKSSRKEFESDGEVLPKRRSARLKQ